jgi:hypothetical protein
VGGNTIYMTNLSSVDTMDANFVADSGDEAEEDDG